MKTLHKLFNIDIKSIDEEQRTVKFCFSDNQEDRSGEIVDQASWDVKSYLRNPIILFGHDSSVPENVLGQGIALDLDVDGKSYVTAQFDEAAINPRADMVFRQLVKRTLRTVSAGFINHTSETDNDVPVLKDNELLEISVVPIPANPRAIALGLRDHSITRKDAKYLLDAMKNETELIEKELTKAPGALKEKDMEELKAQIETLTGLVTTIAEGQATLTEGQAALKADVDALKPKEETAEEKAAREAEEKRVADEAEAKRIADEAAAKGGKNDQPGAEDEIDLDDELTDELKDDIDAQIASALEDEAETE